MKHFQTFQIMIPFLCLGSSLAEECFGLFRMEAPQGIIADLSAQEFFIIKFRLPAVQ